MTQLSKLLGKNTKGDIGIEIEAEGRNFPDEAVMEDRRWMCKADGSLRGDNREFIFRSPLPVEVVPDALKSLEKILKQHKTVLDFSFRTSVHVHINCLDLSYDQYLNFIYTYLLLEEPLVDMCGNSRVANRFCLRMKDAEGMNFVLEQLFGQEDNLRGLGDNVRYAGLNLAATPKFGSLEFRSMEGTMDVERITNWVNLLWAIKVFAKKHDNPVSIQDFFNKVSRQKFVDTVFGVHLEIPDLEEKLGLSYSLTLDHPMAYRMRGIAKPDNDREPRGFAPMYADDDFDLEVVEDDLELAEDDEEEIDEDEEF